MIDFLNSALNLAQFGWKLFPLAPFQKIPAIAKGKGCLEATDDENVLEAWARRFPNANVGLACGKPSNLIVVDLDPRNGSDASVKKLAERKQTFPPTVMARTANGGTHLYYAYEPVLKNSKSALAPGIDIKTTGGYVVAPPSLLDTDRRYVWINSPLGEHLPRLPQWAVEALKPKPVPVVPYDKKSAPKDVAPLAAFVSRSGEGQRNNALYWASCRAVESGLMDKSAFSALVSAAVAAGLEQTEAQKTVASACKRLRVA